MAGVIRFPGLFEEGLLPLGIHVEPGLADPDAGQSLEEIVRLVELGRNGHATRAVDVTPLGPHANHRQVLGEPGHVFELRL